MVGVALLSLLAEDSCEVGLSSRCDEELWPDLTRGVDAFGEDEDSSVDCILHGDDLALPVAECEVVVEEPATELVRSHVLVGLRQYLAEGAGCEVSFCCFDGFAKGCDRALGFYFCFGFGACCSFLFEGGEESDGHVGVGDHGVDGGRCGVHSVFADGGEYLINYPCFELFGFWEFGVEDQAVDVPFGDESNLLGSTWSLKGVVFHDPLAVSLESVRRVRVSEDGGYVFSAEEGCAVFCHNADVVAEVVEDGDVVHQLFSFVELLLGCRFMEA